MRLKELDIIKMYLLEAGHLGVIKTHPVLMVGIKAALTVYSLFLGFELKKKEKDTK